MLMVGNCPLTFQELGSVGRSNDSKILYEFAEFCLTDPTRGKKKTEENKKTSHINPFVVLRVV